MVLAAINAAILAATIAIVYTLVVEISDRVTATTVALVVVLVFAIGQYVGIANYNWIAPYSHEATHGVALALGSLLALSRWLRTGSIRMVALGGWAVGLAFLTKPETFLAGFAGSAVLLSAGVRLRGRSPLGVWVAGLVIPVAVSVAIFGVVGTLGAWPLVFNGEIAALPFYREEASSAFSRSSPFST